MNKIQIILILLPFLLFQMSCSKSEERERYEVFIEELVNLEQDMHQLQEQSAAMKEDAKKRLPGGLYDAGGVVIDRSGDSIDILDNENQRQGIGRGLVYILGGISNFFVNPDSVRRAQPLMTEDIDALAALKRSHDVARVRQRAIYIELHNINTEHESVLSDEEAEMLYYAIDSIYSTPDHPMNYLTSAVENYAIGKLMDLTSIAECDYCGGTGVVISEDSGMFSDELYKCPRCSGTGSWGY